MKHVLPTHPRLGKAMLNTLGVGGSILAPVLGGTLGWHIGKHTFKPMTVEDMTATNKHPLLIPPKVVKPRVKLEVKDK